MNILNQPSKEGQDVTNAKLDLIASKLNVTSDALSSAINLANTAGNNANAKIIDVENRFNTLTTAQQQGSEVVDARQGKASLSANITEIKTDLSSHKAKSAKDSHLVNKLVWQSFEPIVLNGWSGSQEFYAKDDMNNVHLAGRLYAGVTAVGTHIFQLPVGYRPNKDIYLESDGTIIYVRTTGLSSIIQINPLTKTENWVYIQYVMFNGGV